MPTGGSVETTEKTSVNDASDFAPPDYEPIVSLEGSLGGLARRLWENQFEGKESWFADSEMVYTGIGAAPIGNDTVPMKGYGDGSLIPTVVDLERQYGRIPKTLFLVASAPFSEHLLGLRGLARTYKERGVENIIAILTGFPHERQDHMFTLAGHVMPHVTTLKDAIEILTDRGYVNAGFIHHPHSLRSTELAFREGFALLPLDGFKFLAHEARLHEIPNVFVMGPDKGRKDEARILASVLRAPMGSATKVRNRVGNGMPTIEIPQPVLEYIQANKSNVVMMDDEIREAGTTRKIAEALMGYANSLTVCAVKGFFANVTDSSSTAVDNLAHPLISRIIVTDGIRPLNDVTPLESKLEVLRLDRDIRRIVSYLQKNPTDPQNPNWLRDSEVMGTLWRLDLSVEQVE